MSEQEDPSLFVGTQAIAVKRLELFATVFVTGSVVMTVEIVGARVIGPVFGVGLFVWSALLTVTMGALALGYYAGGVLSERVVTSRLLGSVVSAAGVTLALVRILRHLVLETTLALGPRWGSLVSATLLVSLVDEADLLEKMAYTISNPVVAGLVRSPQEWPGVISLRFAEPRIIEMPDVFFDEEGELDEEATLHFVRPDLGLSNALFDAKLDAAVADRVRRARIDMRLSGLPFVGRNTVLRQPFFGTPRTPAPRRNPSPRIAAKRTRSRIDAIQRMLEFQRAYRDARLRWCGGERDVLFPAGTYALRVHARVVCASAVPP